VEGGGLSPWYRVWVPFPQGGVGMLHKGTMRSAEFEGEECLIRSQVESE